MEASEHSSHNGLGTVIPDPDSQSLADWSTDNSAADVPGGGTASVFRWTSDEKLTPEGLRSFSDLLAYCFPDGNRWIRTDGEVLSVRFTAVTDAQADASKRRLDEAARRAAGAPGRPARVLLDQWSLAGPGVLATGDRLPTTRDAFPVGPGLQVMGPGLARLMRLVDNWVLELAGEIGAGEYSVPQLVAWDTIERAGYARAFPQHLTTCAVVQSDLSALDRFARANSSAARATELRPAPVTVSPAVCMHLFAAFANRTLTKPVIATARQSCARHEAGSERSATRLWSFSMREILYVGPAGGARQFRVEMLDRLTELARAMGLPARIASANDPFFTSERQDLASYQSNLDLKHELCGRMMGDSSAVAVSSVNLHNQHFGRGFGINLPDGTPASSACFAFGLERWARWLHGYVGDDPAYWPAPLRRAAAVP
jgi:hypothetical protein